MVKSNQVWQPGPTLTGAHGGGGGGGAKGLSNYVKLQYMPLYVLQPKHLNSLFIFYLLWCTINPSF
jgi:hypothetical protein